MDILAKFWTSQGGGELGNGLGTERKSEKKSEVMIGAQMFGKRKLFLALWNSSIVTCLLWLEMPRK